MKCSGLSVMSCKFATFLLQPLRQKSKIFATSLKEGGKKAPNSSFLDYLWSRGPKDAQGSTRVRDVLSAATRRQITENLVILSIASAISDSMTAGGSHTSEKCAAPSTR